MSKWYIHINSRNTNKNLYSPLLHTKQEAIAIVMETWAEWIKIINRNSLLMKEFESYYNKDQTLIEGMIKFINERVGIEITVVKVDKDEYNFEFCESGIKFFKDSIKNR